MVLNLTSIIFALGECILPFYESLFLYSGISVITSFFFFLYLNSLKSNFLLHLLYNFQFKVSDFVFQMVPGPCSKNWVFLLRLLTFSISQKWRWLKMLFKNFQYYCLFPLDHDFFCTDFCFETHLFIPINSMKSIYYKVTIKGAFP